MSGHVRFWLIPTPSAILLYCYTAAMPDHRQSLLAIVSRHDQLSATTELFLAEPSDAEIGALAEELRELIANIQAKVESKLDQAPEA